MITKLKKIKRWLKASEENTNAGHEVEKTPAGRENKFHNVLISEYRKTLKW